MFIADIRSSDNNKKAEPNDHSFIVMMSRNGEKKYIQIDSETYRRTARGRLRSNFRSYRYSD